jgi:Flp pilus assembly protein TadD/peroxiredoxin
VYFSRRRFIKTTGFAGAFWASRFQGLPSYAFPQAVPSPCWVHTGSGYAPFIDKFLQKVQPGSDQFVAEKYAAELEPLLRSWRDSFCSQASDLGAVHGSVFEQIKGSLLHQGAVKSLRSKPPLESERISFPHAESLGRESFLNSLRRYLAAFGKIERADMQVDLINVSGSAPPRLATQVHYHLIGQLDATRREERTGEWQISWEKDATRGWLVSEWLADTEMRSRLTGQGFVDFTAEAFAKDTSYREQMRHGIDYWRTVLDGASGIDIYGNNGICAGDFDGDGLDDIYVCQPAGLPNRLYRNLGDGTFVDVTEKAGVGLLDGTSSAIFADFNNSGRQDLVVVRTSGPLLFINRGDGTFELRPDAFHFAKPPQGSFTGTAVADYDRDGFLDIYFCTYSFYQGLSEYEFPKPYYDAQNGPPNFLLKNHGNHVFEDVTAASGMDVSNNRFTFDCGWNDSNRDGWPDLYVVNDFGRKVLYRNNGNGTFKDVSAEAGVEDAGEGMSMTWFDYDNDGFDDIYAVNMWEVAGRRVTKQPEFMPSVPEQVRQVYWQDGMGNTLLHNEGGTGKFRDVSEQAGTRVGGWNWGGEAWDFDHDGYSDLYIANGFISGRNRQDLSSFYWRQVAARSLDSGGQSQSYADAWSAINEFIRSDYTWSGYQRNNLYINNRDSTFAEAAGVLGLDCLEDGRSFALSDLDGDGRLELILKNRTAPQIMLFHNQLSPIGAVIGFSLQGTKSNRDAIGAVIEVVAGGRPQRKTIRAGSGFLAQNSKVLHFGLGEYQGTVRATIEWPSGTRQTLENLPPGHRIEVREDSSVFRAIPFRPFRQRQASPVSTVTDFPERHSTWLLEPITPPKLALPDQNKVTHTLVGASGSPQLLIFWRPGCSSSTEYLHSFERVHSEWHRRGLNVLAVITQGPGAGKGERKTESLPAFSFPVLLADERTSNVYNIFYRYLFDRRRQMELPTSFLLNREGKVVRVYSGEENPNQILEDSGSMPETDEERLRWGLPFPGQYFRGKLHHNYFTYGVAYLQYQYLDEALAAFQLSIESNISNPSAYYNLGLIYLNKGMFSDALTSLQKAVKLDPSNADAWNNLGVVQGQEGNYGEAQHDFQKALDLQPTHLLAIQNMVKLYRFQGHLEAAQALIQKAISMDPTRAELHQGLAMLYVEQKDLADAKSEFEKATQLDPENAEMLNGLGVVLMEMGDSENAVKDFEKCRQLAPDFDRPYLNMAVLYLSAGQLDKARSVLTEFLKRDPNNQDIRQALQEVDNRK